jgi:hypothetical protein
MSIGRGAAEIEDELVEMLGRAVGPGPAPKRRR